MGNEEYTRGQHRQILPGEEPYVDLPLESRSASVAWLGCTAAALEYASETLNSTGLQVLCGLATVATVGAGAIVAPDFTEYVFARYVARDR